MSPVTVTQVAGPPSGSGFSGNTTTPISYRATTPNGDTAYCNFDVVVSEYLPPVYCGPPSYNTTYEYIGQIRLVIRVVIMGAWYFLSLSTTLAKVGTYPITLTPSYTETV